jgi:hypothetical protein
VTTEIMLVVALCVAGGLFGIVVAQYDRIQFYIAEQKQDRERIKEWIVMWKNEKHRADKLQVALRLEQIAHSVEE